jgi:hypothetical protein
MVAKSRLLIFVDLTLRTAGFSSKLPTQKIKNAEKNIYFQDTPSIPLEIAQ